MLKLRRDLFLLIARNAKHPGPALDLLDGQYPPDEKDAAELENLRNRVMADRFAALRPAISKAPDPAASAAALSPAPPATPTYAKFPPLKVSRRWTAGRIPDGPAEEFYINAPGFDSGSDTVWLFATRENSGAPASITAQDFIFEVSLPSLTTVTWPLPEGSAGSSHWTSGPDQSALFATRDHLYLAKRGEFLAIGDRKSRQWTIKREAQPSGSFVPVGGELFFLTKAEGARGLASLSLSDGAVTVLASNRRTPPQTPLDRPDLAATAITANASGIIEITTEPFVAKGPLQPSGSPGSGTSLVTYDPVGHLWTEPKPAGATSQAPAFPPLVASGPALAFLEEVDSDLWTIQLPRPGMPKVCLPVEFVEPDYPFAPAAKSRIPGGREWYWTRAGYVVIRVIPRPCMVHFIPQSELNTYLDAHIPGEDESSTSPPAPTKR